MRLWSYECAEPLNRLLKLTFGKVSYSIFSVVAQLVCLCIFKRFSTTFRGDCISKSNPKYLLFFISPAYLFTTPTPRIQFFSLNFEPTIMSLSCLYFTDLLFLFFPSASLLVLLKCPRTTFILNMYFLGCANYVGSKSVVRWLKPLF